MDSTGSEKVLTHGRVARHPHPPVVLDCLPENLTGPRDVAAAAALQEHLSVEPAGMSLLGTVRDSLGLGQGFLKLRLGFLPAASPRAEPGRARFPGAPTTRHSALQQARDSRRGDSFSVVAGNVR